MSTNQTPYPSAAGLVGNVNIERNVFPTIRASIRRLDPDGISNVPYYPSIAGKILTLFYTTEPSVSGSFVSITFTGNSLAQVITNINAAVVGVIQAFEQDGFLVIRNLNPGKTHVLTVSVVSPSSDNAAPILGFAIFPFPGNTSYAGEYAPAPSNRKEINTPTTALITRDEDLNAKTFNRAFYALLQLVETMRADLARDIIVHKDISVTTTAHTGSAGFNTFKINDDDIRLFYPEADTPSIADLNQFYRVLQGGSEAVSDVTQAAVQVNGLFYTTALIPISTGVFSTWLTPDGGSIVSATTKNKTKHPATAITSINGNIVFCTGATFLTHKIKAGDPVQLIASNLQPFDHSGWYAVDAVIDDTHLAIRPMNIAEQTPINNDSKPRWMNSNSGGTLRVAMGRFVPAGDVFVSTTTPGSFTIRLSVGVPFNSIVIDDQARELAGALNSIAIKLYAHLSDTTDAHAATAISGFTSATTWRDGTNITGADLKTTIEDILTDLSAQASSNSGTGRIGAEAISIGGASPNALASGTILSQLTTLLTDIRDHIANPTNAHAASAIGYSTGPAWEDGTTNPSTTLQTQVNKIISDLATSGGASKIKFDAGTTSWADATLNLGDNIQTQIVNIVTALGGAGGASKIRYDGGANWADGTTNPATRVEVQLDKIVNDLSASTGTAKIGGAATSTDIAAGTLATQISDLAVNWLKLSRANTITGAQTFSALLTSAAITASGLITANGGITTSSGITYTGSAEEHFPDRQFSIDCSGFQNDFLHDNSQGFLQRFAFDGSNPIVLQSFIIGAGNGSGSTKLVAPLARLRVGDKITTIIVVLAQSGSPNGSESLIIDANTTVSSETTVFSSGLSRPGTGVISTQTITVNYTVTTGVGLRIAISTSSSSGGTMYLRHVIVNFQRP